MNKIIITRWKGQLLTVLFTGKRAVELGLEADRSILGNIYIGIVKTIVRNLNSAFVDLGNGQTGYYSLTDNPESLHMDGSRKAVQCGDEIIVQVEKEAVRTKDPVLTANLNFAGRYAVLTAGKHAIGFSAKISDRDWKEQMRSLVAQKLGDQAGVIIRTNAWQKDEELLHELELLLQTYQTVLENARYRTAFSMIYEAEPEYIRSIRNCPLGSLDGIVTDVREVYETLTAFSQRFEPDLLERIEWYEDTGISLRSLYSLETILSRAIQKQVWLNSGGYLVIEHTEAMTVIDVNTGKYSGKKNQQDTIRMINLEAVDEIARQIRLRNISGIILIDLIDMKREEDRDLLLERLRLAVRSDPVKTTVVDMTPLNLVEMTRKKEKKPLWEQISHVEKG
ncbi:MAG: ribonuclease E/G [Clostridiales bacterium]|nr:ribonuclease E/G [Clostridiales bacterium]